MNTFVQKTFKGLAVVALSAGLALSASAHDKSDGHRKPYPPNIPYLVINTRDLVRSEDFYKRIFGMKEVFRYQITPTLSELALGFDDEQIPTPGAQLVLVHDTSVTTPPNAGNMYNRYVIAVPDLDRTYRRLMREGVTVLTAPTSYPQFNAKVFFARDPDGFLIEVLEWIEVERKHQH